MSDIVKLIIEIPKEEYNKIKEESLFLNFAIMANAIKNGTPLDDVKLKIEQDMSWYMFNDYGNETAIHRELWEILDNIGKGE